MAFGAGWDPFLAEFGVFGFWARLHLSGRILGHQVSARARLDLAGGWQRQSQVFCRPRQGKLLFTPVTQRLLQAQRRVRMADADALHLIRADLGGHIALPRGLGAQC